MVATRAFCALKVFPTYGLYLHCYDSLNKKTGYGAFSAELSFLRETYISFVFTTILAIESEKNVYK